MKVALGPINECHTGVHSSFQEAPPPGVVYQPTRAHHHYVWADQPRPLFDGSDIGEFVSFSAASALPVHAVRWPVLGAEAWLVDVDDFMYPVFCGRYGFSRRFRELDAWAATRSQSYAALLRARIRNMVWALSHPSCRAVLFRSERERRRAVTWVDALHASGAVDDPADVLDKKSVMAYPVVQPAPRQDFDKKWNSPEPIHVVFCGRDFEKKNGAMAIRVVRELAGKYRFTFTYIGAIPDRDASGQLLAVPGAEWHPALSRDEVRRHLARAHILFHPSKSESLGIVLLEAVAAGMACVVGSGEGMKHVEEIFGDGEGATFVPRAFPDEPCEAAFAGALEGLLRDRSQAQRQAVYNFRSATSGPLSLDRRNLVMCRAYQDCAGRSERGPIRLADLPVPGAQVSMTEPELSALCDAFLAREGRPTLYARLSMDL